MEHKPLKLFYDGRCPICVREMRFLERRTKDDSLVFQDIHAQGFDPASIGKTSEELMQQIHAVYPDGEIIRGVGVFREAYRRAGLGWLLTPTGWPVFKLIADFAYRIFARNRLRISRLFGRKLEEKEDCERCSHFDR